MTVSLRRSRRGRATGFSLIELMVVIAIMGLLATVVTVNLMSHVSQAKFTKVASDFQTIQQGIDLFKLNMGRYPRTMDELWTQPGGGGSSRWQGPYLKDVPPSPKDPWGTEYAYVPATGGSEPVIVSYGEDGAPGGTGDAADLTSKTIRGVLEGKGL